MTLLKAKKSRRGIDLFLLELIIVLLFMSISVTVILNMFSVANSKAEKSLANEKMLLYSQSVSELFSAGGDLDFVTERLFGGLYRVEADGTRVVYLNKDFFPVGESEPYFTIIRLKETREEKACGVLSRLYYEFTEDGETTFSGKSTAYIPDFEVNGNG